MSIHDARQAKFALHTIDCMTEKVFWVDESGRFIWVNDAASSVYGYTREEFSRMGVFDINPAMTPERWAEHWRRSRESPRPIEAVHRKKDGADFPVEISNNFLEFEGRTYSCAIVRDITERREREQRFQALYEELQRSERRARLSHFTVQRTLDAIYWINRAGAIKHVNRAACRMTGYTYEELTAMSILDINRSVDRQQLGQLFDRLRQERGLLLESGHYTREGKEVPVEIAMNYIEFEGEAYTCSIVRDITERRQKEAALRGALMEIRELKDRLEAENNYLQEEIKVTQNFGEIISQSPAFREVLVQVEQVADTDATVLVYGETGTGKELIARALHQLSRRSERPMIKVNCAALPANLIESELFGHEKGAFTGALERKNGRFRLAHEGTLFLDEIGELPVELQAKLLRVLQEGEFEPLGSHQTQRVDVRIIAATNRNLEKEVEKGRFREDLYYRLNVFPIHCIPLRERKEDIPLLVRHFCKKFESRTGRKITHVPKKMLARLEAYDFPGNIRELENIVERAVILSRDGKLDIGNWLPLRNRPAGDQAFPTLDELQRRHIIDVLRHTGWRVSGPRGAAKILGLPPTTLESKMKKLGIERSTEAKG